MSPPFPGYVGTAAVGGAESRNRRDQRVRAHGGAWAPSCRLGPRGGAGPSPRTSPPSASAATRTYPRAPRQGGVRSCRERPISPSAPRRRPSRAVPLRRGARAREAPVEVAATEENGVVAEKRTAAAHRRRARRGRGRAAPRPWRSPRSRTRRGRRLEADEAAKVRRRHSGTFPRSFSIRRRRRTKAGAGSSRLASLAAQCQAAAYAAYPGGSLKTGSASWLRASAGASPVIDSRRSASGRGRAPPRRDDGSSPPHKMLCLTAA